MSLHPEALDRIIPAAPWEAARSRYADLATEDRPGNPWEEPFDASDEPVRVIPWIAVAAVLLIGLSLIASIH